MRKSPKEAELDSAFESWKKTLESQSVQLLFTNRKQSCFVALGADPGRKVRVYFKVLDSTDRAFVEDFELKLCDDIPLGENVGGLTVSGFSSLSVSSDSRDALHAGIQGARVDLKGRFALAIVIRDGIKRFRFRKRLVLNVDNIRELP